MKQEQINELMKRYLEGDTTLEEEQQLYQYFREQDDIPQSLLPYRQMLDLAAAEGTEKEDEPLQEIGRASCRERVFLTV